MTRREFAFAVAALARARPAEQRPNIILITGDHLRWDHVGINGNPAKEGYLPDAGNPYILWFADSPAPAAMIMDL